MPSSNRPKVCLVGTEASSHLISQLSVRGYTQGHGLAALKSHLYYDFINIPSESLDVRPPHAIQVATREVDLAGYTIVQSNDEVIALMGLSTLPHREELVEVNFDDTKSYGMCVASGAGWICS